MTKVGSIARWCIIRDSIIQELQEKNTIKEPIEQKPKKKSVKCRKRRIK